MNRLIHAGDVVAVSIVLKIFDDGVNEIDVWKIVSFLFDDDVNEIDVWKIVSFLFDDDVNEIDVCKIVFVASRFMLNY